MSQDTKRDTEHLIRVWLTAVFKQPPHDYPYPTVVMDNMTVIVIKSGEAVSAREYTKHYPLPSPIVPVILGKPERVPPGRWIHVDKQELKSYYGENPSGWFGIDLDAYHETLALMEKIT